MSANGSLSGAAGEEDRGPVFLHEPPSRLHFSNTTGALLPCSAHGNPPPQVEWLNGGDVVTEVADVCIVHKNGSLQFLPFPPYAYTAGVHAATYSCRASSSAGTIISRPVHVRAVVRQYYEVQVYDEFVISGNTAVIKCHVPSFVRDYVSVTSWIRGNGERIVSDVLTGGRYSVFATGELHIRHVTKADEFQSYHCETQHILTDETTVSALAGRLMVNEPRSSVPPRITDSRSSIRASVRDTVELPCAAQGYPIPQYKWHRVNRKEEVPVVQDGRIKQVGGSLLIRQVTAGDAGRYVCVASSSVGSERTHTTLEVWAPLTAHITPQVQTVDVGSIATFNCSPEGFPQESILWFKDGERLEVTARVRVEGQRTVIVEDVRREDRGMYQCLVKNFEDTAQGSAQLKLGDASPQWRSTSGPKVVSPGATVMLMCAVQGSPPPVVTWTLQGQPVPNNDPRIKHSQKVEGDHVEGQLNITSIRVEDGGDWTCEARNRAGRIEHAGRLDVRGPPTIRPMRPLRVVAGRTAMFNCIVAGYPIESIYWEKNGVVLPVSERQEVHSNGTLEIRQVSREADSGQYICVATSGENTARANLQVNVMVPPQIDERMFSLGSGFPAKSRARIMCVVERGDLPLSFTWTHDGRPITPGPSTSIRSLDEVTSVLLFTSLREEDGGKYTCTATNAVASDSRTVELVVKVAPTWKVEPEDASVVVGEDLLLPCAANGSPTPTTTWRRAEGAVPRQYRPVTSLGENVRVSSNSSLMVQSIKRNQGGEFLCSASNDVGSDLSKSIRVTVRVPPQFEEHEENVTVSAGRRAMLKCEAYGDLPIAVTWTTGNPATRITTPGLNDGHLKIKEAVLNGSLASFPTGSSVRTGSPVSTDREQGFRSVLSVSTKSRHDSKVFFCLATNIYGNDTKTISLIVQEVPGTPGPPRIIDSGSRTVNLTWSAPSHDGNSPITTYRIMIINSTDSWMNVGRMKTVEVSMPIARIDDLMPAQSYLVRVVGINSVGASKPSPEVRISTAHEPPTATPTSVRIIPLSSTSLRVTWQPPDTVMAQRASLGYYVGYKVANSSEPFRYQNIDPSPTIVYRPEVTLKSLQKFTSYEVTVQAFNSAGAGPRTSPITSTTEEDVPSEAPRDVHCSSLSSSSILVRWTPPPPTSLHGILQGYKLVYRPVHRNRFFHPDDVSEKTVVTLSSSLLGLDRYTNYSVMVAAYTRRGDGVRSDPVHCVTEEDVPGPVESVKALAVDGQSVLVAWRPPKLPNGVITKYSVHLIHPDQQDASRTPWGSNNGGSGSWSVPGSRSPSGPSWESRSSTDNADNIGRSWVVSGSERQYLVAGLVAANAYGFTVRGSTSVGEGPTGRMVIQRPRQDAPAAIASFSDKTTAVWGEEMRLACRVVGNPTPTRTWTFNGKVISSNDQRMKEYPDGNLLITDVKAQDTGNYTCSASNIHGSDVITYTLTVQVPPSPPLAYVSDVTSTTLTVRWRTTNNGGALILGYYLYEKREFGEWRRIEVPAVADSYTLTGLQCGTRYQVYVTAYNHVGASQPSDAIPTKTLGREPIVPTQSSLLRVNVTSISLNLAAWLDGGCPITSMVVEYKERGVASWTLVSNHVRWDNETEYVVLDLNPAHRYTLRVTAHNSAGSSVATYPFTTLTPLGATLSPEVVVHGAVGTAPWYLDSHILMAVVVACILVVLAACIAIAYTCRRTRTHTQTYKEVSHVHNDLTPDSGLTSDTMTRVHSLEILEAYTPSTLPLGAYDEISPYATFRMPGNNKTPPPPPLPSPVVSAVETNYSRVKRKCPMPPEGGLPPTPGNASSDITCEKNNKSKNVSKCPSIKEKATTKEASGSSVTSVSSNHEELVRAYHAHANDSPTTPESGRRNKCGVATSSEVTTESDTTAEPDLVSFCAILGNTRALRVPALFKQDGDYQTVADMVGGRSRTESTTSHEESSDEARGARSHRRSRGQEPPLKQGHRPSRGDPEYSYARPVKKPGPPPPPLSSTESNSAEYGDGWARMDSDSYSRRHTLEFSEAECDHPSFKKDIEPLEQLIVDLEKEKILFDPNKTSKAYAAVL
ncbi:Down syndrome cell adhesion molecule-like protein Dscam2 isoform X2 [Penaeus chinensis]|uniref:Down syndrome cell adhesion molecule-like protein Dscam2 isoform X2 n=1 Tax=Penaeus chinensis TaxID=139456 RepID=UPI001FB741B0|nr:Down syndrome cell adhesion molecule-like protein Dscam2 isoform X2 [Penaeus chinensis]